MVLAKAVVEEELVRRRKKKPMAGMVLTSGFRTYLFVMSGCIMLFGANAMMHGLVAVHAAQVEALAGEVAVAENSERTTELEIAYLSSYPRIAREAESRLGMHAPVPGEMHFVAQANPVYANTANRHRLESEYEGLSGTVGGWLHAAGRASAITD
jgi:hypothetical protein